MKLFSSISLKLMVAAVGAVPILTSLSPASVAQPFPGRTFGCSVPSGSLQDDPSGLGTQQANALIVTPDASIGVPVQGSLAVFSQVGAISGQGRCIQYRDRLNSFNTSAYSDWVFDVGMTGAGYPAICFRPANGFCGVMTTATPMAGGGVPGVANSFEVFPLATGRTQATTALANLTTNIMGFANAAPIID
ncbi:MAG: hypothetical protein F6K00_27950 [Leptolyngbya sp. SIOISBB]|nr:hypothetical protein [Leptolyngbya sp. SIOISBB]